MTSKAHYLASATPDPDVSTLEVSVGYVDATGVYIELLTGHAPTPEAASQPSGSSEPSCKRAAIQRQVGHSAAVCSAIHASAGARSSRMDQVCRCGRRRRKGVVMTGLNEVV